MTTDEYSWLKPLDDANVYNEVQFAEYGGWFAALQPGKGGGNVAWWHAVFPNTTCNATLCQQAPTNPSNKCCRSLPDDCGQHPDGCLTNTTDFDIGFAKDATPLHDAQGRPLKGFRTMPNSSREAYEIYRSYYNSRIAWITSIGDKPYARGAHI